MFMIAGMSHRLLIICWCCLHADLYCHREPLREAWCNSYADQGAENMSVIPHNARASLRHCDSSGWQDQWGIFVSCGASLTWGARAV